MNLSEEQFIHEGYSQNPALLWKGIGAFFLALFLFAWGIFHYTDAFFAWQKSTPFLQVTNREMSLFLWQNPSFMRVFAKEKNSYLPAFEYHEKIGLKPEYAEEYVSAPPELLFAFHSWKRLISTDFPLRAVPSEQFYTFLLDTPEWQLKYWKQAPKIYVDLLEGSAEQDFIPSSKLPTEVLQAFIGWKNFFLEGDEINDMSPTYAQMAQFLDAHPRYARNFWRNIVGESYLKSFGLATSAPEAHIPQVELSPFLRVALYNFLQEEKSTTYPK